MENILAILAPDEFLIVVSILSMWVSFYLAKKYEDSRYYHSESWFFSRFFAIMGVVPLVVDVYINYIEYKFAYLSHTYVSYMLGGGLLLASIGTQIMMMKYSRNILKKFDSISDYSMSMIKWYFMFCIATITLHPFLGMSIWILTNVSLNLPFTKTYKLHMEELRDSKSNTKGQYIRTNR